MNLKLKRRVAQNPCYKHTTEEMKNSKEIFKALTQEDKLHVIEKVFPHSGNFRQLDNQGLWTDGQWDMLAEAFMKSVDWTKGIETDKICVHDSNNVVNGISELGNAYEGIGFFSDNELLFIEDLEFIGSGDSKKVKSFEIEESKRNKGCFVLVAITENGEKFVVGGNPHFPNFLERYKSCWELNTK